MNRAPGALRRTLGLPSSSPPDRRPVPVRPVRVSGPPDGPDESGPGASPAGEGTGPTARPSAPGEAERSARTAGLVLLVDDNAGFRGLAARVLSGWGYEVVEAGTVADAVASVVERRPHTVVVDIGLPDGDGFGLTEHLVALPSPPRVVLISTDADAGNRTAAYRAGAVGFLPKDELLGGALQGLIDG